MKKILITFGTTQYYGAMDRLVKSAKPYISGAAKYNETGLPQSFYKQYAKHFEKPRGFGYWVWKPYLLNKTLEQLDEGDVVMYVDSTNYVVSDLTPVFDLCTEHDIVMFDNRDCSPTIEPWTNDLWTKWDCFSLMGCTDDKYIKGNQVNASYQLYKKCDKTMKFLEEYMKWASDPRIITDIPNETGDNLPQFRDHRHDQSIASLMAIKHNIHIERDPSQFGAKAITADSKFPTLFNHYRGIVSDGCGKFLKDVIEK